MGSRVLENTQFDQFLPAASASAVADRVWTDRDIWNAPQIRREERTDVGAVGAQTGNLAERMPEGPVLRGMAVAIGIEALTVLVVYGAWRILQLTR
jgi:hypothetical protein